MSFQPAASRKRKADYRPPHANPTRVLPAPFTPIPGGRSWTISVAIPSSLLDSLPTSDARLYTISRIARSLAIFSVDEVVIFNDQPPSSHNDHNHDHIIAHALAYLDCPPFMREALFPPMRCAALLPSLDAPHHPNSKDPWIPYREGIALCADEETPSTSDPGGSTTRTLIDAALDEPVSVIGEFAPKTRVTLRFDEMMDPDDEPLASVVHPDAPREQGGYYWGYAVRRAPDLSSVFTSCPYAPSYDLTVGVSSQGMPLGEAFPSDERRSALGPSFQHMLIVLGGADGLERAAANDGKLVGMGIYGPRTGELFDRWVDVVPGHGSRAVETDEAMYIALTALRSVWSL